MNRIDKTKMKMEDRECDDCGATKGRIITVHRKNFCIGCLRKHASQLESVLTAILDDATGSCINADKKVRPIRMKWYRKATDLLK